MKLSTYIWNKRKTKGTSITDFYLARAVQLWRGFGPPGTARKESQYTWSFLLNCLGKFAKNCHEASELGCVCVCACACSLVSLAMRRELEVWKDRKMMKIRIGILELVGNSMKLVVVRSLFRRRYRCRMKCKMSWLQFSRSLLKQRGSYEAILPI